MQNDATPRSAGSRRARPTRVTPIAARMQNDTPPRSAGSRRPRPMPAAAVRRDRNPHAACTDGACTLRGTPGHRPHELHARLSVRAVTTQPATTGNRPEPHRPVGAAAANQESRDATRRSLPEPNRGQQQPRRSPSAGARSDAARNRHHSPTPSPEPGSGKMKRDPVAT